MILIIIWWLQKFKKRLAVSKEESQKFHVERVNPRNLMELEVRKKYQIETSNSFAALVVLNDSKDKNRAWENIKGNNRSSAEQSLGRYELKQHKAQFY